MLESDPLKVDNQVESQEGESENHQIVRVMSWQLSEAVNRGYVIPGYRMIDYIRMTWQGLETDPKNPYAPEKPRTRFILANWWGEQGSTKSAMMGEYLGLAYGAYDREKTESERRKAWDFCQKVMICNRKDLKEAAKLVPGENDRLKLIVFDDLNSILGKQLSWEDRELYRVSFNLLGMIRRKAGCILTTEPNIEMVIGTFNEVANFEGIVYPNSTFKYERLCHDIHPYFRGKDKLTKIIIEKLGKFDPYQVDPKWWEDYQKRTKSEGHGTWGKVIDRMGEMEEGNTKEGAEVKKGVNRALKVPSYDVGKEYRKQGGKLAQQEIDKILNITKKMQQDRASGEEE